MCGAERTDTEDPQWKMFSLWFRKPHRSERSRKPRWAALSATCQENAQRCWSLAERQKNALIASRSSRVVLEEKWAARSICQKRKHVWLPLLLLWIKTAPLLALLCFHFNPIKTVFPNQMNVKIFCIFSDCENNMCLVQENNSVSFVLGSKREAEVAACSGPAWRVGVSCERRAWLSLDASVDQRRSSPAGLLCLVSTKIHKEFDGI